MAGEFEALGVNVAAMSYDDVDKIAAFAEDEGIGYPLLSDKRHRNVNALGIRNEEYARDHFAYGVPHPGIFYVDATGTIALKRAVPGYRDRPPLDELHSALVELLAEPAN